MVKEFNKSTFYVVEGLSALSEYIRFRPKVVKRIVCKKAYNKDVFALLSTYSVKISVESYLEYEKQCEHKSDIPKAPVWAEVALNTLSENDLLQRVSLDEKKDVIVALDHVTDSNNLGAIARTMAFFGLRKLVAPKDRQVLFTNRSVRTSQGAFSLVHLYSVVNLTRLLLKLKEQGYWIIGADANQGSQSLDKAALQYEKAVIVFGSEDKGLSKRVSQACDLFVQVERAESAVSSLNVSVAAGIFLHKFTRGLD